MTGFTYNVLLAATSPDDVVEKGEIGKEKALSVLKSFPFQVKVARREQNPDLMAPTLTFHNNATAQDLAIWSEAPDRYTIWKPDTMANADHVEEDQHLSECVALFFDERDEELNELIENSLVRAPNKIFEYMPLTRKILKIDVGLANVSTPEQ